MNNIPAQPKNLIDLVKGILQASRSAQQQTAPPAAQPPHNLAAELAYKMAQAATQAEQPELLNEGLKYLADAVRTIDMAMKRNDSKS